MQGELIQSGARVKFDGLPMVHADEGQVRQVFQNLIQNAIKYRSPQREPEIVVTAELDGSEGARMWRFCVADNGLGVKPEDASRIFERFGRGTGASGRSSGVGLGLAVCKRIVEQHGGRIWVETPPAPAEQGQVGARFCFTLPSSET
jgi:signal transduction histidine kinase